MVIFLKNSSTKTMWRNLQTFLPPPNIQSQLFTHKLTFQCDFLRDFHLLTIHSTSHKPQATSHYFLRLFLKFSPSFPSTLIALSPVVEESHAVAFWLLKLFRVDRAFWSFVSEVPTMRFDREFFRWVDAPRIWFQLMICPWAVESEEEKIIFGEW